MNIAFPLLFLVLGSIIGSFLNVVILRLNTGRGLGGRSSCMSCSTVLKDKDLVPIASYVALGGKCAMCKSKISPQYPLVEAVTAVIFFLLSKVFMPYVESVNVSSIFFFTLYAIIFSLLIVISVYDMRHTIIPDKLVFAFIILSFLTASFFFGGAISYQYILYAVLLAVPLAMLWYISKGKWMGLGDAKLALGIGFLLGGSSGALALMFAFWMGAIVSIVSMLLQMGKVKMSTEIPFAPFMVLGTLMVFFLQIDFMGFLSWFMR